MFFHGQDAVSATEAAAEVDIQAANLEFWRICMVFPDTFCMFTGVPVFLYNCVDVFRPYLIHEPSPYPFLLLAFSLFLCYHKTKSSPFAAGRTVGVLYRPAVEN